GETLWRIARTYGVTVEELQRANGLSVPAQLEVGARLFVPGANRELAVPPPDAPRARMEPRTAHRSSPAQIPRAGARAPDPASGGEPLAWPVRGVIISGFGTRDREHHDGLDLACPEGTPVFAAAEGEVLFSGEQRGYGNLVLIRHARGLVTVYAHNAENLVERGDHVLRGEPIATVGRRFSPLCPTPPVRPAAVFFRVRYSAPPCPLASRREPSSATFRTFPIRAFSSRT